MAPDYGKTRRACYFAYLATASVFSLPPMLFVAFRELYGISYTLLGTLLLVNFCTQLAIDLVFGSLASRFNIRLVVRLTPLLTALGLTVYALVPALCPSLAFAGLLAGTVLFSVASGLCEVLLSPLVAALPSEHPERDMSTLHSLYGWGVVGVVLVSSAFFRLAGTQRWMILTLFWATLPVVASVLFFRAPIPDLTLSSPETGEGAKRRRSGIFLCVACIFLGACAENTMTGWISSFMENALLVPKAVGDVLGMAMFAFLLALHRTGYAKWGKHIQKALLFGMTGATVCYIVAGCVPQVTVAFVACVLTGFFTAMLWPGTLILLEETYPNPGVTVYALMAAGGDLGASVAPQALGVAVDCISAGSWAKQTAAAYGLTPDQVGLRVGVLLSAVLPLLGVVLLLVMRKVLPQQAEKQG